MTCIENTNEFQNLSRLVIKRLPHVVFFAQSYNIPGLSIGSATQYTALSNKPWPGDKVTFNDFFVTFIVDEDFKNFLEITKWVTDLGHEQSLGQYKRIYESDDGIFSDMTVSLLTNKRNANKRLTMQDAFPYSISDIMLDNSASDGATLTATASFKYQNWIME
jgi:hypothetical protein